MKQLSTDFLVLGGGISGLICANRLQDHGREVLLVDKQDTPGGVLQSLHIGSNIWDRGAHTFAVNNQVENILKSMDAWQYIVEPTQSAKVRQLRFGNKIRSLAPHPLKILTANYLSLSDKWNIIRSLSKLPCPIVNPTVFEFFQFHFGTRITKNIVSSVFAGIYAGDVERLEMRSVMKRVFDASQEHGSVIKSVSKLRNPDDPRRVMGVRNGMGTLAKYLWNRLDHVLGSESIIKIESAPNGYKVTTNLGTEIACKHLISTIPAFALARLLSSYSEVKAWLDVVHYEPMVLLHIAYQGVPDDKEDRAFGFLCSQYESPVLKGAIYNSSIFSGRSALDGINYTVFMKPQIEWLDDEDLLQSKVEETIHEFETLKGISVPRSDLHMSVWRNAIPQFNLGYDTLRKSLMAEVAKIDHLDVSGSYISGVSVTDCIQYNSDLADRLSLEK